MISSRSEVEGSALRDIIVVARSHEAPQKFEDAQCGRGLFADVAFCDAPIPRNTAALFQRKRFPIDGGGHAVEWQHV